MRLYDLTCFLVEISTYNLKLGGAGPRTELVRMSDSDQPTLANDRDLATKMLCLCHVMGGQEDSDSLSFDQRRQIFTHAPGRHHIQPSGGFVQ